MAFLDNTIPLTTSAQALVAPGAGQEAAIFGFVLWNATATAAAVVVQRYVQASGMTVTIATVSVPAYGNYPWPNRISLSAGDQLIAYAGAPAAVTADLNWYLATGTIPVASGFNPRGAWSSTASYNVNDVVSYSAADYIAMTANTNSQPPSADWMSLVNNNTYSPGSGITIGSGTIAVDRSVIATNAFALIFGA